MTRFRHLLIAASVILGIATGATAQDGAQRGALGLDLREVVIVRLQDEARYGGEDGPVVRDLLLLVVRGLGGLPPVGYGGAPDPTYYVDTTPADILSSGDETAVFVVPMPEQPDRAVFWRLDVDELVDPAQDIGRDRPKTIPPNAVVGRDLAARFASEARQGNRAAVALEGLLGTARRIEIEANALSALGRRLKEER